MRLTKKQLQRLASKAFPGEQFYEAKLTMRFLSTDDFKTTMESLWQMLRSANIGRRLPDHMDLSIRDLPRKTP